MLEKNMRYFHSRFKYLMRMVIISMAFLFNSSACGQDTVPKTYAELSSEEKSCLNVWLEPQNYNINSLIQNAILPADSRIFPAIKMCRNYVDAYANARKNVPCDYKGKAYQSCNEYWVQENEPDSALRVNDISKLFGWTKTQEEVQKINLQLSNGFFPNQSNLDQTDSNKDRIGEIIQSQKVKSYVNVFNCSGFYRDANIQYAEFVWQVYLIGDQQSFRTMLSRVGGSHTKCHPIEMPRSLRGDEVLKYLGEISGGQHAGSKLWGFESAGMGGWHVISVLREQR